MGSTLLVAMETNVRNDLKDIDATNYLWTTAEIDRHIAHAVNDYQRICPVVAAVTQLVLTAVSLGLVPVITSRQQVAAPAGYLWPLRVECPVDTIPPTYLMFREEYPGGPGATVTLFFPNAVPAPQLGLYWKLWFAGTHTLSAGTSTILQIHEEFIVLGASAYASQAATRYTQGRLNASEWTPRGMQAFATERMAAYVAWLATLRREYPAAGNPFEQWGQVPFDRTRV